MSRAGRALGEALVTLDFPRFASLAASPCLLMIETRHRDESGPGLLGPGSVIRFRDRYYQWSHLLISL